MLNLTHLPTIPCENHTSDSSRDNIILLESDTFSSPKKEYQLGYLLIERTWHLSILSGPFNIFDIWAHILLVFSSFPLSILHKDKIRKKSWYHESFSFKTDWNP